MTPDSLHPRKGRHHSAVGTALPPTRPRLRGADRIQNFRPSVFTQTRELAERYGAIALGQGHPD
ncbi:hypothetical protein [Streptomyces sp. NPDC088350]|uniref:hypothetical protein n=1 Tax=Streptomyces sp. NPDC088350 TaxID=3365854 RepID=UPI00381290C5